MFGHIFMALNECDAGEGTRYICGIPFQKLQKTRIVVSHHANDAFH
jgi:hypothetical protein